MVSPSLALRCCTFFILNIFYCLIIMPSQAILELSRFLWAWSAPKLAWPPLLVVRHPEDQRRNYLFANYQEGDLTSFFLDCEASSAGNDSAFVRSPVASVVTNRHRDWHHPTLEVLWFLRADLGKTNNKNQYPINILDLPAMRKSIIHPLHQLLAPDPYLLFQLSTWLHHSTSGLLLIIWFTKSE